MASNEKEDNPFRKFITADGSSGFPAESNRYHLYTSTVCPYAQRSLIVRKLKGLEEVISTTSAWKFDDLGWAFTDKVKGCSPEPFHDFSHLRQVYQLNVPGYTGTVSVPTLYDKQTDRVVNIESADLMQMFNREFNKLAKYPDIDLYPEAMRGKIDEMNEKLNKFISNTYKCLFSKTQEDYDTNSDEYFAALEKLEETLTLQRYLCGEHLTDSDVRLFVVLIRWDLIFYTVAKLNYKRITDYPNLLGYLRELYQIPAFGETIDLEMSKKYVYTGFMAKQSNSNGIVPKGPNLDLNATHGRDKLPGKPF